MASSNTSEDDFKAVMVRSLASSTVHGISHAASTKGVPLKVMWSLLFLTFLGLFFYNSIDLVEKMRSCDLTKSYELDKVEFVFPDLYFCPSNPYSGSFPYVLTKAEADQINSEIDRVRIRCEKSEFCRKYYSRKQTGAYMMQRSMSVDLVTKLLAHRKSQSVLFAVLISADINYVHVKIEEFNSVENLICFKTALTDSQRTMMMYQGSAIHYWLSTDPYFPDFVYSGHPVKNIIDKNNSKVVLSDLDYRYGTSGFKSSGYTILAVPPSTYPSMNHEYSMHIAPGHSYSIKITMEANVCKKHLWNRHCVADPSKVALMDPRNGNLVEFDYSYAYCYYSYVQQKLIAAIHCQVQLFPLLWNEKNISRCFNFSEQQNLANISNFLEILWKLDMDATKACRNQYPCRYLSYLSSFSFEKWPSLGGAPEGTVNIAEQELRRITMKKAPALAKLVELARSMAAGNHSAHLEGITRSYASEALVSVRVSAASLMSPQVTMSFSYSFSTFMADVGGLLGLYIGCSLMTFCEILELLWSLGSSYWRRLALRRRQAEAEAGADFSD